MTEVIRSGGGFKPRRFVTDLYSRLTIKGRLLLLVAILFAPCCALVAYALWATVAIAEDSLRRSLVYSVQTIAVAVDAEFRRHMDIARLLAGLPQVMDDDLASFDQQARKASASLSGSWVIVSDADGNVLVNTASAPGQALGRRTGEGLASQLRAIQAGKPSVSDVFVGPVSQAWITTVDLPIFKDGRPFRCVTISIPAAKFAALIDQQQMPAEWLVGIMDGSGKYVARVPKNATETGQLASAGWRAKARVAGLAEFPSIEGDKVINANALSALSDWTIGVGIRQGAFARAIYPTIAKTTLAAVGISLGALLLAISIARSIVRPLERVGSPPRASAGRVDIDPPEIRALNARLAEAEAARDRSESSLRDNIRLLAQARDAWSTVAEQLKLAAKYGRLGTFVWDAQSDVNTWSEEIEELYGLTPGTFGGTYDAWLVYVHPDDRQAADLACREALATGELHSGWRIVLPDGTIRSVEARARILNDAAGRPRQMIGVNIDVTAAKEAERRRELLLHELAHRVKNSFAVVQSLAYQLLPRRDPKVQDFVSRLHALAAAHTSLAQTEWRGADLDQLVKSQVLPFAGSPGQLVVDGPQLLLPAQLTTQLALVIHELGCNASKYGALSVAGGRVQVDWSVGAAAVHFRWRETGGPPVEPPSKAGFGTRLLDVSVADLRRSFAPTGFACEFDIALPAQPPGENAPAPGMA